MKLLITDYRFFLSAFTLLPSAFRFRLRRFRRLRPRDFRERELEVVTEQGRVWGIENDVVAALVDVQISRIVPLCSALAEFDRFHRIVYSIKRRAVHSFA